jgi:hypothetical protein
VKKLTGFGLFALGAISMIPVVAYARHRKRHDEIGGVMEPMTEIYTPASGTVDDAELLESPTQAETPTIVPD